MNACKRRISFAAGATNGRVVLRVLWFGWFVEPQGFQYFRNYLQKKYVIRRLARKAKTYANTVM